MTREMGVTGSSATEPTAATAATTAVPPGPLAAWLRGTAEGTGGELSAGDLVVEPLSGGSSNLTFRVRAGERSWVLRRPPLGRVLATANDMGREVTVQRALAGSDVPVPAIVAWCDDEGVIGAPFYLMEWLGGVVYRDAAAAAHLRPDEAAEASHELIDVLARIHTVDPVAVGLEGFGRPDGFLARQVRRWSTQWERSTRTTGRAVRTVDETLARLADRLPPAPRAGIVHGDYSFNNAMYRRDRPGRMLAVLDWEMSTLGDPLTDLGMLLAYWGKPGEVMWRGRAPQAHRAGPGYPSADDLAERYAARTGTAPAHLAFYQALATIKLAVIAEGALARMGVGTSDQARRTAETVAILADLALRTLAGA